LWTPRQADRVWKSAHAVFSGDDEEDKGRWRIDKPVPESWPVKVGTATMLCRLASFRHMGLFPEQMPHWQWMLDDAAKFVAREVRRGKTYDVVLVDPPKFGRGPDGEVWDLFTSLPPLMKDVAALLAPQASLVLTVYAIRASSLAFEQLCREVLAGRGGTFQSGELAIREENGTRAVSTSLFTRWSGA
jgi:hypothetical protein